jgi:hypothetical protein
MSFHRCLQVFSLKPCLKFTCSARRPRSLTPSSRFHDCAEPEHTDDDQEEDEGHGEKKHGAQFGDHEDSPPLLAWLFFSAQSGHGILDHHWPESEPITMPVDTTKIPLNVPNMMGEFYSRQITTPFQVSYGSVTFPGR